MCKNYNTNSSDQTQKCDCLCLGVFHSVHFIKCFTVSLVQIACQSQLWTIWATLALNT